MARRRRQLELTFQQHVADYKVLFDFSDFVHPETNQTTREHAVNELQPGELIEDRFEGDDYRIMVVANKFQTGFDQPLQAGTFLDRPVVDRNAVQTVSRLNRCLVRQDLSLPHVFLQLSPRDRRLCDLRRGQALCSVFRPSEASTSCTVFRQSSDWWWRAPLGELGWRHDRCRSG